MGSKLFIPTITLPDTARDPWLGGTEFPKVFYYDDSKPAFDGNTWSGHIDVPVGSYTKDWRLNLWVSIVIKGEKQLITYPYKKDQL